MDLNPNTTPNPAPNSEQGPTPIPESIPGLEALMDSAWPAAEREESDGWVLRAASGVTQRANSVWPRDPGDDPAPAAGRTPGGAALVPGPPASADLPDL